MKVGLSLKRRRRRCCSSLPVFYIQTHLNKAFVAVQIFSSILHPPFLVQLAKEKKNIFDHSIPSMIFRRALRATKDFLHKGTYEDTKRTCSVFLFFSPQHPITATLLCYNNTPSPPPPTYTQPTCSPKSMDRKTTHPLQILQRPRSLPVDHLFGCPAGRQVLRHPCPLPHPPPHRRIHRNVQ